MPVNEVCLNRFILLAFSDVYIEKTFENSNEMARVEGELFKPNLDFSRLFHLDEYRFSIFGAKGTSRGIL